MKTKYRIDYRAVALLTAVVMLLTSMRALGSLLPVVAEAEENGLTIRDDAMHFFIRHWHTDKDDEAVLNPGEEQGNDQGDYFVVVEGYIMPNSGSGYVCYAVDQAEGTKGTLIPVSEVVTDSPYIERFDAGSGTVYLTTKPLIDSDSDVDDLVERFAGISISAGHNAVTSYSEDRIAIQYTENIHLVKGHVFYQNKSRIVTGTYDQAAFDVTRMFDDDEIDTAWALTYKSGVNGHSKGDLVMSKDTPAQVCVDLNDLPNGISQDEVEWTKYYSTAPGLHTDKTIVQSEDGRAFLYDLEAWYTEGYAAQVGLVLDASGSMAFALDKPSVINVNTLGLGTALANKIGFVEDHQSFFGEGDLIGYYEFQKNGKNDSNTDNYRTWYLNSAKDPYTNYNTVADFTEEKKGNFAKTVKQPTQEELNSGNFSFGNSQAVWLPEDIDVIYNRTNSGWGDPVSFGTNDGFWLTDTTSHSGFLLEVAPKKSDNFTISFSLQQKDGLPFSNNVEILYIGPTKVTDNSPKYFRVYLTGNDIVALYGNVEVVRISNAFTGNQIRTISFTFGEDGMTAYLNGDVCGETAVINDLTAEVIVFDPFEDNNNNGKNLAVDSISLFDTELDKDEVKDLHNATSKAADLASVEAVQKTVSAFLTEAELALILNTRKVDNSYLGFADYSYYIYNPVDGTEAYAPITYYTNTSADINYYDKRNVNGGEGWYYISCASGIGAGGTSKRLDGLPDNSVLYDTIEKVSAASAGYGAAPDVDSIEGNTNQQYTQSGQSPIKFYIDSNGNLRCFFAVGQTVSSAYTSFVYELKDKDYIRTEGLQRVLGSFANTLNDRSPAAQLSAVQFSNDTTDTTGKLLLDWTSDSDRMTGFLSLNKGGGIANSPNRYGEYNYAMTGGTYTDKGLAAFRQLLADKDYKHDGNAENDISPRYLILFTDGEYNSNLNDLVTEATTLKSAEYDYTIFVVLLTDKGEETAKTKNLARISGTRTVTVGEDGYGTDGKQYYFHISDLDELAHAFMTDIIDQIVDDMKGYTVTDYIDPRFDLQSADGTTWHLHANGEVMKQPAGVDLENAKKDGSNYTKGLSKTEGMEFHLSGDTDPNARNPMLYYDEAEDMYYLEWENQTIPTCGVGSDRLEVWIAQVWVIAKEDFIGGNDILVGGNAEKMNWVYHPNDTNASSGTVDAIQDPYNTDSVDTYRSKGFPRPVVNVQLMPLDTFPLDDAIFKGEYISHAQILTEIEDDYVSDTYYLEYLRRYAYQRYLYVLEYQQKEAAKTPQDIAKIAMLADETEELKEDLNKPLIELLNEWLGIKDDSILEKAFSVPYMYLPSVEHNNDGTIKLDPQTGRADILTNAGGKNTHQRDVIGILTYRWTQVEPGEVTDEIHDYVKDDTEQNKYSLTVEFTPLKKGDTLKDVHYLAPDGTSYYHDEANDVWYIYEDGEKTTIPAPEQDFLNDCTRYETLRSYIDVADRDHIFAHYLPIEGTDGNKSDFKDNEDFEELGFNFDRAEAYVNGSLITDEYYKWDSDYKPARNQEGIYHAGDLQPVQDSDNPYKYGTSSRFINNDRTLESQAPYIQEIVSGGVVLELRMLVGELAEWLNIGDTDATIEQRIAAIQSIEDDYTIEKTFTLNATRSFTVSDVVRSTQVGKTFEDYGDTFTFTFKLEYTGEQLKELEVDNDGYVTFLAKASDIECEMVQKTVTKTLGGQIQVASTPLEAQHMNELPIGTYEFKLDDANNNDALDNRLHFGKITYEEDVDKFVDAYDYFDELVLNGLNTTNEYPEQKWKEIVDSNGTETTLSAPEILKSNIEKYIAEAETAQDKQTVTFYIGTDKYNHRGELGADSYDPNRYTYDRLGIIRLSTGMTMLTIEEKGADEEIDSRESFIYRITGTTLGGKAVDLTVSVHGNSSTDIVIAPGDYTITELHDWSWRYNNVNTYGKYDADTNVAFYEDWVLYPNDLTKASVSIRYKDDLPENDGHETFEEHKTVIYEHERNDKVWLGGENYKDNHFDEVQ